MDAQQRAWQPVLQPLLPGGTQGLRDDPLSGPPVKLLGQRAHGKPVEQGSLKIWRLYGRRFATHRDAMDEVINWLTFYNHRRLHSTLGRMSPMKFEANWHAVQIKKVA